MLTKEGKAIIAPSFCTSSYLDIIQISIRISVVSVFNMYFDFFCFSIFSELKVPTVVVLNTSNQQYFLLDRQIKNAEDMVQFINNILDGTVDVSFCFNCNGVMGGGGGEMSCFLLILKERVGRHPG